MTPIWLTLTLPAVQLIGAGWIACRKQLRQRYPAFLVYLLADASLQILYLCVPLGPWISVLLLARAAAVFEVLALTRLQVPLRSCCVAVGLVLAACAITANLPAGLSTEARVLLFRRYCYLAMCLTVFPVALWRQYQPALERAADRAYRLGFCVWLLVVAISSTFVRGGIGFRIFPATGQTWRMVNWFTYGALTVTVAAMSWAMARSPKRRKVAVRAARVVVEYEAARAA